MLVKRDDPADLAKGITSLLEQPSARAEFGERGRRGVDAVYAWPRVAQATAAVYAEAIAERRGRPASTTTSASEGTRQMGMFWRR